MGCIIRVEGWCFGDDDDAAKWNSEKRSCWRTGRETEWCVISQYKRIHYWVNRYFNSFAFYNSRECLTWVKSYRTKHMPRWPRHREELQRVPRIKPRQRTKHRSRIKIKRDLGSPTLRQLLLHSTCHLSRTKTSSSSFRAHKPLWRNLDFLNHLHQHNIDSDQEYF